MLCGACGSEATRIGEKFNVSIARCAKCGSVSADCEEPDVAFYENGYFGGGDYGYAEGANVTTNLVAMDAAARRRLAFLESVDTIVEVGAGGGSFVKAGLNKGLDIRGVERSVCMRQVAMNVHGVELMVEIPGLKDRRLALVLIEVIEHVKKPSDFLQGLFNDLGKLPELMLLTTPNGEAVRALGVEWAQIKPPEHLLLFTAEGLRQVLEPYGYKDFGFRYYHSIFLDMAIKKFGSRSRRKVPVFWSISSLLRYGDSALCRILPKRFALGLECYCAR